MVKKIISTIRQFLLNIKFKRAVKKANHYAQLTGMKFFVLMVNGKLRVVSKRTIRRLIHNRTFAKGVKMADIEKKALFITH